MNGEGGSSRRPSQLTMTILAVDDKTGRTLPAKKLAITNYLWKMRQTKPLWEVIEAVLDIWSKQNPTKWKAYLISVGHIKEGQKVTKGWRGVSKDKKTGGYLRYVVDFPQWVMFCIRKLYPDLKFDKKFFIEFARRFPRFRVAEKA